MKIIFSNNISNLKPEYIKEYSKVCAVSNFFCQKNEYKTILYSIENSYKHIDKINYDEVHLIPNHILDEYPLKDDFLKMYILSNINEPFLFLNNNVFLTKKIDESYLSKDLLFFCRQLFFDIYYKIYSKSIKSVPEKLNDSIKYESFSTHIFGGQKFEIFNSVGKDLSDFLIKNKNKLTKINDENKNLENKKMVDFKKINLINLVENLWLPHLLSQHQSIDLLLDSHSIQNFLNKNYNNYVDNKLFTTRSNNEEADLRTYSLLLKNQAEKIGVNIYSTNNENLKTEVESIIRSNSLKF